MGFAVSVHEPGRWAIDDEMGSRETPHIGTAVDGTGEKTKGDRYCIEEIDLLQNRDVELPVVYLCAGCDETVVAILVGIGDRDDEGRSLDRIMTIADGAGLRAEAKESVDGGASIGLKATASELVEAVADLGIKAEAHGIEKWNTVGRTCVDGAWLSFQQSSKCAFARAGDAEVPAEAVARAAGYESEDGVGANECGCHLIHGSVTADRDDETTPLSHRMLCEFAGVTWVSGLDDRGVEFVLGDKFMGARKQIRVACIVARARVEDETGF